MRPPLPRTFRLRDVVRERVVDLAPDEVVLRVPYDLFRPDGPAQMHGSLVQWVEGGLLRTGRVAPVQLADTHAGERVLVQDAPGPGEGPPEDLSSERWWLCEVEAVDGIAQEQ